LLFAVIYSVFDDFAVFEPQTPQPTNQSTRQPLPRCPVSLEALQRLHQHHHHDHDHHRRQPSVD
jgi:hypothetical protein